MASPAVGPELVVEPEDWPDDFVAAYEREWTNLVRFAYLLIGDRGAAEELAQEAFMAARPRWHRLERPLPYLRTCIANGIRDRARRQAVAERRTPRPPLHALDAPDELWDALRRLDLRRRTAIVGRYYLDLSELEIAEILGCRPTTVRTLIHRGLRDLRRELAP